MEPRPSRRNRFAASIGAFLLVLISLLILGNGLAFPYAFLAHDEVTLVLSIGLLFAWFCVTAIVLAFLDFHPFNRILFGLVIPMTLFGLLFMKGIDLTRIRFPMGPPFRQFWTTVLILPLICMALGWTLWLFRIVFGWKITKNQYIQFDFQRDRVVEAVGLVLCLAGALGLSAINWDLVVAGGLMSVGGLAAIVLVAPITFWMMKTRHPLLVWCLLVLGIPMLTLIVLGGWGVNWVNQGSPFSRPGMIPFGPAGALIPITVVAAMVLLIFFMTLCTFLVALRMRNYQLWTGASARPKRRTTARLVTKTHPLDD